MFTIESSPQTPLRIIDRLTTPDQPGVESGYGSPTELAVAYEFLGLGSEYREEHISTGTALTISAVWACVRWISQTIASLSFNVFDRTADGNEVVPLTDSVSWLVGMQPNPEVNAFEFWQALVKDALTFGNGYAEIERDGFGRIKWLWRISPDRVQPQRNDAGNLIYTIRNPDWTIESTLRPEQTFHLKNLGSDGIVGWSTIELARRSLEIALAQDRFGVNFFRRGAMPSGILQVPGSQTPDKREQTRKSFQDAYGGSKKAGNVVVVGPGYTFTPLAMPNKDAEWIAGRTFELSEVCRWYGVPPHKIADLARMTNNNIEHQAIEAVQDCLLPWCRRLESEADIKLFGQVSRGRRFTRLNLDTLLRGDSQTQTSTIVQQVNGGLRTPNEGRKMLGMNPTDGGDELLVQGAMTTLERVIDGTAQVGNPAPNPAKPKVPGEPTPGKMNPDGTPAEPPQAKMRDGDFGPFYVLLSNCFSDFLRIEADKAKRAANKGKLAEHCETFYGNGHEATVTAALSPIFAGFLLASGRNGISGESLAKEAATRHIEWSKRTLTDAGRVPDDWESRAGAVALAELELAWSKSK